LSSASPRCEFAAEICGRVLPALREVDGRTVACHRAEELDLKLLDVRGADAEQEEVAS
jgi:hypothetical protein